MTSKKRHVKNLESAAQMYQIPGTANNMGGVDESNIFSNKGVRKIECK
jgi:hypothetical protein